MKQTQAKEFWIKNKSNEYTDDQFWATEQMEYDTDIHVVVKTPLISAASEMLEALERSFDFITSYMTAPHHEKLAFEIEDLIKKAKGE